MDLSTESLFPLVSGRWDEYMHDEYKLSVSRIQSQLIYSYTLYLSFDSLEMMDACYLSYQELQSYYNNYKAANPPSGVIPAFSKCLYGIIQG